MNYSISKFADAKTNRHTQQCIKIIDKSHYEDKYENRHIILLHYRLFKNLKMLWFSDVYLQYSYINDYVDKIFNKPDISKIKELVYDPVLITVPVKSAEIIKFPRRAEILDCISINYTGSCDIHDIIFFIEGGPLLFDFPVYKGHHTYPVSLFLSVMVYYVPTFRLDPNKLHHYEISFHYKICGSIYNMSPRYSDYIMHTPNYTLYVRDGTLNYVPESIVTKTSNNIKWKIKSGRYVIDDENDDIINFMLCLMYFICPEMVVSIIENCNIFDAASLKGFSFYPEDNGIDDIIEIGLLCMNVYNIKTELISEILYSDVFFAPLHCI